MHRTQITTRSAAAAAVLALLLSCVTITVGGAAPAPLHTPPPPPSPHVVTVFNCSDPVACSAASRVGLLAKGQEGACLPLPNNSGITAGSHATFQCVREPLGVCVPTNVYWDDPTCTRPTEVVWSPCDSCLQDPARFLSCAIVNGTFRVFVQSCGDDATCSRCDPINNKGLPPQTCYKHPGVPGLYLKYGELAACGLVRVQGYSSAASCASGTGAVSQTVLPAQGKCVSGVSTYCEVQP